MDDSLAKLMVEREAPITLGYYKIDLSMVVYITLYVIVQL